MKRNKQAAAQAPAEKPDPARALARRIEWAERRIAGEIEAGAKDLAEFKQKMTDANSALYRLGWLGGVAERLAEAALNEKVVWMKQENPLLDFEVCISNVVEYERRALLNDNYRGSSTSAFSNATEGAKRTAASRFVARWSSELEEIKKLRAEVATTNKELSQ